MTNQNYIDRLRLPIIQSPMTMCIGTGMGAAGIIKRC